MKGINICRDMCGTFHTRSFDVKVVYFTLIIKQLCVKFATCILLHRLYEKMIAGNFLTNSNNFQNNWLNFKILQAIMLPLSPVLLYKNFKKKNSLQLNFKEISKNLFVNFSLRMFQCKNSKKKDFSIRFFVMNHDFCFNFSYSQKISYNVLTTNMGLFLICIL